LTVQRGSSRAPSAAQLRALLLQDTLRVGVLEDRVDIQPIIHQMTVVTLVTQPPKFAQLDKATSPHCA
jgi:hypothetical protein